MRTNFEREPDRMLMAPKKFLFYSPHGGLRNRKNSHRYANAPIELANRRKNVKDWNAGFRLEYRPKHAADNVDFEYLEILSLLYDDI